MTNGWKNFNLKDRLKSLLELENAPQVGTKVFHPSYGEGVIEQVKGSGATGRVTVDFGYAKPVVALSELNFDLDNDPNKVHEDEPVVSPEVELQEAPSEFYPDIPKPELTTKHDPVETREASSFLPELKIDYYSPPAELIDSPPEPPQITIESASTEIDSINRPSNFVEDPFAHKLVAFESCTVDCAAPQSKPPKRLEPIATSPSSMIEARKGLMALRLGQVLESQVLELSIGTSEIESELRNAVSKAITDKPVFVLLDADWGAGKTHALTMLQALARQKKMATSCVVMDGVSASLTTPMELLSQVMSSLRFSDDPMSCDLSYQLSKAGTQNIMEYMERRGAHYIPETLSSLPPGALDDNEIMDTICDFFSLKATATDANKQLQKMFYSGRLKTIKASRVYERASRFVTLLKEWAIFSSAIGCNGLLLVLDELDVEYAHTSTGSASIRNMRLRRRNLLEQLSQLDKAPLIIAFAAAPGGFDENEENDPVLDIIRCFGSRINHIRIPSQGKSDFRLLLDRLLNLYADAYGLEKANFDRHMTDAVFNDLFEDYQRNPNAVIRRFVRSSIERMDVDFI